MADDHSNPPAEVWLDSDATVRELAAQAGITARSIGGAIVDGLLLAFYRAADGCLTQLTPNHVYWSEMVAYLTGKTTRTELSYSSSWVDEWKLNPRYRSHERTVAINRHWIDQVIIKKEDYAAYLRGRGEPLPGWWFASTEGADAETSDLLNWEGFDEDSDTYPPELDIAMQAWRAVTNRPDPSRPPKEQVHDWLEHHYPKLSEEAKNRIAIICNWEKSGGRLPRR